MVNFLFLKSGNIWNLKCRGYHVAFARRLEMFAGDTVNAVHVIPHIPVECRPHNHSFTIASIVPPLPLTAEPENLDDSATSWLLAQPFYLASVV